MKNAKILKTVQLSLLSAIIVIDSGTCNSGDYRTYSRYYRFYIAWTCIRRNFRRYFRLNKLT